MITIAGGILLAIAILAIGFLAVILFISGIITQIAWEFAKWLFRLALWLSLFPIVIWTGQSKSSALTLVGLCTAGAIIVYLDRLSETD